MQETLWFDQFTWLIFVTPFLGLLTAGLSKRQNPVIRGGRVLRHDAPARVSHWSHALGTTMLLVSGIVLGSRFTPSFVTGDGTATWFNIHFVFALLFLFGTFYWLGNTIISRWRLREHLPTRHVVGYTLQHYGALLGVKSCKIPPEEKYFESERAAFILAVAAAGLLVISGIVKVLAHVMNISAPFMNVFTWVHDISAAAMLVFFVAHVFFAAIAPFSWKTFPSMITGYVSLDQAEHEHAGWVEELEQETCVESDSEDETASIGVSLGMQEQKEGI